MRVNGPKRLIAPEFRQDAVALMERGGLSYAELSNRLGVGKSTLYKWYRAEMARKKAPRPKTTVAPSPVVEGESDKDRAERLAKENAKLQRRVAQLEEDRAILKKAAAFFAKESE